MKADFQVGIVGAGFAGLVAALRLKKSGRDNFIIFERASEVGGTWRENIYPGCACDVASPLYSFAGEPNLGWSKMYASQPEILAYIKRVVANNGLDRHLRLNTDVVEVRFLESEGYWKVIDRKGNSYTVAVLLLGLGPLNRPHIPRFEGLEEFRGRTFHSARWDSSYDLKGKRVAVIGTGASAIQIVPSIAPMVKQLLVLQRTPAWVAHRFDKDFSGFSKWLFRRFPLLQQIQREVIYWLNELSGLGFIGYSHFNRLMAWLSLRKLKKEVKDPEVRKKLQPHYTIGCKRILRSDDFYPTFNRSNVQLITASIERFTQQGIRTKDGQEHFLDAVIFATGFVAADIQLYTKIVGRQGRLLIEEWKEKGAEAFLGTTVAGYPNMGFILGPNTGLGHNSVIHMMESQMNYLMQYIEYLEQSGKESFLEVREEVQEAYNKKLQRQFKGTVWNSGCQSWYMNEKGRNTTLYPRLTTTFRKITRKFNPEDYHLVQKGG
ncbi:flavin-containing monooxygenase [Nafulsella turpanensis]|uniref:flavin-containing monooxygenase n=1 Tax=Nafulsella turpanensis TaxID=1265690 RepID=UPI0003483383|nr:NAD(P)/FAD-dependent oxidoreductase [Nafulsella turpanensis]